MPIHGRLAALAGPVIRQFVHTQSRHIYSALRIQDRIIDKTYRKAGLYNRGLVRGVQHGLAGGQVIGGLLQLGLNGDTSPTTGDGPFQKSRYATKTNKSYKARRGRAVCFSRRGWRVPSSSRYS